MDIALVFATAPPHALEPYGSGSFLAALRDAGLRPRVIPVDPQFPAVLERLSPRALVTFGDLTALGPVWAVANYRDVPLLHVVGSVTKDLIDAGGRFAAALARRSSRHVCGVLGSSRADVGRMLDAGFFSRARFSMIAPPPVERQEAGARRPSVVGAQPVFGHFDPEKGDRRSLDDLLRAVELTGQPEHLTLRIAREDRRTRRRAGPANVTFVSSAKPEDFIEEIDVLLVTEPADRLVPSVAAALAAGRVVVAPDAGVMAELLDYGRHGVLFAEGSAYHLAKAINEVAASWQNRPFDFASVEASLSRLSPQAAAATFAQACRRLAS